MHIQKNASLMHSLVHASDTFFDVHQYMKVKYIIVFDFLNFLMHSIVHASHLKIKSPIYEYNYMHPMVHDNSTHC